MINITPRMPIRKSFQLIALVIFVAIVGFYFKGFYYVIDTVPTKRLPPPPKVDVLKIAPRDVLIWNDFSGHLTPLEAVEIKPRVSGMIEKVLFTDGQKVTKGQPLYVIDSQPQQAAIRRARGELSVAQAKMKFAKESLDRAEKLFATKLIAPSFYDSTLSTYQVAQAEVEQAQGSLMQAQQNLEYAFISAPITGQISRSELTEGNIVEAGMNAPILTKIVANSALFAEFNVDEATFVHLTRTKRNLKELPVQLTIAGDETMTYKGNISSFDNRLDTNSGTIRTRALFSNTDGALTVGMFVKVRLGSDEKREALLLPDLAIGTNQNKRFVYIVTKDNTALYREVSLGDYYQGQRIIVSGIKPGDAVIVNGLSYVRPNSIVVPNIIQEKSNPLLSSY